MGPIEFRDLDILEMITKPGYNNKNYLVFSLSEMGPKRPEDNKMCFVFLDHKFGVILISSALVITS